MRKSWIWKDFKQAVIKSMVERLPSPHGGVPAEVSQSTLLPQSKMRATNIDIDDIDEEAKWGIFRFDYIANLSLDWSLKYGFFVVLCLCNTFQDIGFCLMQQHFLGDTDQNIQRTPSLRSLLESADI